ncbi:MAG: cell envelope integrity protein TolA [Bdellovibrionales bacterium]|nr:cell envelope integrity protein TolA [Bdellovibrionales bacterium]
MSGGTEDFFDPSDDDEQEGLVGGPSPTDEETDEEAAAELALPPEPVSYGVRRSVFIHVALLVFVILKSLVFPGAPIPYVPALRVDVVGLPDLTKAEMERIGRLPEPSAPEDAKAEEAKAPEPSEEEDEMALALKREKEAKAAEQKADKNRGKQMRNALDRIKALNRITDQPVEAPEEVKGNIVSKGTSLSGDAQEKDEPGYLDEVHSRVKNHWELPLWLERQQLSAKLRITIDSRGMVRSFSFVKPSGHAGFDQAVRDAVTKAQPLPAPPSNLRTQLLTDGIILGFPL